MTAIIASMRSDPIDLGSATWARGEVTGELDITAVPDGDHHLIIDFADAGITLVADVTVARAPAASVIGAWIVAGVIAVAVVVVVLWRRVRRVSDQPEH